MTKIQQPEIVATLESYRPKFQDNETIRQKAYRFGYIEQACFLIGTGEKPTKPYRTSKQYRDSYIAGMDYANAIYGSANHKL